MSVQLKNKKKENKNESLRQKQIKNQREIIESIKAESKGKKKLVKKKQNDLSKMKRKSMSITPTEIYVEIDTDFCNKFDT